MNDGDFYIDLLDENGQVVGQKLRRDVVKGGDIYHAVYCVLVTPEGEIVLNLIAARSDMPNLHAGSYGCTAATIRRSNETGEMAMQRALKAELKLEDAAPRLVEETMIAVDDTHRLIGLYEVEAPMPTDYNREDIQELVKVSREEFAKILEQTPEKITPVLLRWWKSK